MKNKNKILKSFSLCLLAGLILFCLVYCYSSRFLTQKSPSPSEDNNPSSPSEDELEIEAEDELEIEEELERKPAIVPNKDGCYITLENGECAPPGSF